MRSWADDQLAVIRPNYPGWDIWFIRYVIPKPRNSWHARPKGYPVATLAAETPEELCRKIAEAESP